MSSQSHSSPGSIAPHPAYDQPAALLSAQFLATVHDEFVLLDCSSGLMSDLNAPAPIAPVHSRLALTWGAVARLHAMLGSILAQKSSATMTNSLSAKIAGTNGVETSLHQAMNDRGARLPMLAGYEAPDGIG